MALIWTGLAWFIGTTLFAVVMRIFVAIGIGFVVYTGMDYLITDAVNYAQSKLSILDPNILQSIHVLKLPEAMSIILSAHGVALSFKASEFTLKQLGV